MSDDLDFLWEILDLIPEGIKKITEIQNAIIDYKKSVIAANEDIKGTDETVTPCPSNDKDLRQSSPPFVDLEESSDGVYRPVRKKLNEKI